MNITTAHIQGMVSAIDADDTSELRRLLGLIDHRVFGIVVKGNGANPLAVLRAMASSSAVAGISVDATEYRGCYENEHHFYTPLKPHHFRHMNNTVRLIVAFRLGRYIYNHLDKKEAK